MKLCSVLWRLPQIKIRVYFCLAVPCTKKNQKKKKKKTGAYRGTRKDAFTHRMPQKCGTIASKGRNMCVKGTLIINTK